MDSTCDMDMRMHQNLGMVYNMSGSHLERAGHNALICYCETGFEAGWSGLSLVKPVGPAS